MIDNALDADGRPTLQNLVSAQEFAHLGKVGIFNAHYVHAFDRLALQGPKR